MRVLKIAVAGNDGQLPSIAAPAGVGVGGGGGGVGAGGGGGAGGDGEGGAGAGAGDGTGAGDAPPPVVSSRSAPPPQAVASTAALNISPTRRWSVRLGSACMHTNDAADATAMPLQIVSIGVSETATACAPAPS